MLPFLDIRVDDPTEYGAPERPRDWPCWYQRVFENDIVQFLTAPTDGDIAVWLPSANVLVMGDLLVNGGYPVIEESSRGSLRGMINALERLSRIVNADTVVVPGHGAIGDRRTLFAFADLLRVIEERVQSLLAAHSTPCRNHRRYPYPRI
jgi:cyclase